MSLLRRHRKKEETELSPILKLEAPILSKILDFLSLPEVNTFGQTCKKGQQIAGEYFQQTYKAAEIRCSTDGLYAFSDPASSVQLNGFNRYVQKLVVYGNRNKSDEINVFDCILSNCTDSLRHIQLVNVEISKKSAKSIQKLLEKVEILEIDQCTVDGKLYQDFLKYCKQLKRLSVRRFGGNIKWLNKHYRALEHLELYKIGFKIEQLKEFFEHNQSIRHFAVDANCLWQNEQVIMSAITELDELIVDISGFEFHIESICSLLKRFYERKFYKRLYLYAPYRDKQTIEDIVSVHGVDKLFLTNHIAYAIFLPNFCNLKELSFRSCPEFIETGMFAEKLANLERVHFEQATLNDILLFIMRLSKLNSIKVERFKNADDFNYTIDLKAMNERRNELYNACKVIIYVEETIFLKTKWMTNANGLSKIEIQRNDSYEGSYHFEYSHRMS